MKTARDVAHEIYTETFFEEEKSEWIGIAAKIITAFAKEWADNRYSDVLHKWADANKNAVSNARAEALEEAAKVADDMTCGLMGVPAKDSLTFKNYVSLIAKNIRALKEKSLK